MSARCQAGYLRCVKHKNGSSCWEFLWRENGPLGKHKRRTMRIGSVEEYPTKELAANAVSGLRTCINAARYRQQLHPIQMSDLIDHYILTELSPNVSRHSPATRIYLSRIFRVVDPATLGHNRHSRRSHCRGGTLRTSFAQHQPSCSIYRPIS